MEGRLFCVRPLRMLLPLLLIPLLLFVLPGRLAADAPAPEAGREPFATGLDRLDREECRSLRGLRVGLITNAAAVTGEGEAGYRMMLRHGVRLGWIMAPEHGFLVDVAAGEQAAGVELSDSLRVHSLYGATRTPDERLLREVDLVVFDLQDVGVRCYTYLSTMKNAMLACRRSGTAFMVLDRPNPISPLGSGGFMLDPGQHSFVGAENVPFVHSLTLGELAFLIGRRHSPDLDLRVVGMRGWRRDRFGDELHGFRFSTPSPNIGDVATAVVYPATVLIEATSLSEGRGTPHPFMQFGAPFVDAEALARALEGYDLEGVRFSPVSFTPRSSKWEGRLCHGVRLRVTDRHAFDPFRTAVSILHALHSAYPEESGIDASPKFFDRLAGTTALRRMLLSGATPDEILEAARAERERFRAELLY